jgi:signal transduction histidine kinase
MAYFLAAAAASGVFIAAGWRGNPALALAGMQSQQGCLIDPVWGDAEADIHGPAARADIEVAMRLALKRLAPIMANRAVQADIAALPGLPVRMRGAALAELLEETLAAAIHGAPASRLVVTAATHGNRIDVGITDDMPGADLAVRLGSVRGLTERVARRGGTLEVDVRPAEGTTITLGLAAAADA